MKIRIPSEGRKSRPRKNVGVALKIKLCGQDGMPLAMRELREGLLEAAKKLRGYESYRAKSVALYLTIIDDDGKPIRINNINEMVIYPYKAAADEYGL